MNYIRHYRCSLVVANAMIDGNEQLPKFDRCTCSDRSGRHLFELVAERTVSDNDCRSKVLHPQQNSNLPQIIRVFGSEKDHLACEFLCRDVHVCEIYQDPWHPLQLRHIFHLHVLETFVSSVWQDLIASTTFELTIQEPEEIVECDWWVSIDNFNMILFTFWTFKTDISDWNNFLGKV